MVMLSADVTENFHECAWGEFVGFGAAVGGGGVSEHDVS